MSSFWDRITRREFSERVQDEADESGRDVDGMTPKHLERTATALMENPVTPEVPTPIAVASEPSPHADILDEYEQLAASVGFAPKAIQLERLRSTLADMSLYVYERAKVEAYLTSKFGKAKRTEMGRSATWVWRPMRQQDCATVTITNSDVPSGIVSGTVHFFHSSPLVPVDALTQNGQIQQHGPTYDKPIPMPVLHTVKRVLEQVPDAKFYVSDETTLAERFRDPFLGVILPGVEELVVIERWDEPSFR